MRSKTISDGGLLLIKFLFPSMGWNESAKSGRQLLQMLSAVQATILLHQSYVTILVSIMTRFIAVDMLRPVMKTAHKQSIPRSMFSPSLLVGLVSSQSGCAAWVLDALLPHLECQQCLFSSSSRSTLHFISSSTFIDFHHLPSHFICNHYPSPTLNIRQTFPMAQRSINRSNNLLSHFHNPAHTAQQSAIFIKHNFIHS